MATWNEEFSDYIGGANGKRLIMKTGTIQLATEGADAEDMPASLFGLTKFHMVNSGGFSSESSDSADARYQLGLRAFQTSLFLYDLETATDANRGNAVNANIVLHVTIIGE